jgi:hypothetical protein
MRGLVFLWSTSIIWVFLAVLTVQWIFVLVLYGLISVTVGVGIYKSEHFYKCADCTLQWTI